MRTLGTCGRAAVKGTGTKNVHDGFLSPFLLWTSAVAATAPKEPSAFAVTEALHSKREPRALIELLIFSSPPDLPQDTNGRQRNISLL